MCSIQKIIIVVCVGLVVGAIVGIGISDATIYSQGTSYAPDSQECPVFPTGTSFRAEKQVWEQWKWNYQFTSFNGKIEMKCPAFNRDANLFIDDKLVVQSDVKTFSSVSRNNIHDCHGKIIYVTRTADVGDALLNWNGIFVSFQLWDADETNVLAYVDGTHIFDNDYDIKDTNGASVAHISRNFYNFPWYWDFTIYDANSPGADMRVLSMIAGVKSFEPANDDDSGDGCNQYFWTTSILILVIVCVAVVVLIIGIIFLIWKGFFKCSRMGFNSLI